MIQLTDTVKHLIIVNVLFFAATLVFKSDIYDLLAIHFPMNDLFQPWQYVTHIFMHGDFRHLLFNMLGLWMFGSTVEQLLGKQKFLFLYFSGGIGASLFSLGIDYIQFTPIYDQLIEAGTNESAIKTLLETGSYNPSKIGDVTAQQLSIIYSKFHTPAVGASGAIYGIMVALAVLMPRTKMGMMFIPIQIEARYFIPLILLGDVFFGVFRQAGDNTGHFAYVGGAIVGFIIIWYWKQNQFKF